MTRFAIACAAMTAALCLEVAPAAAASVQIVKTFSNVIVHFASGTPDARTLAVSWCASHGWGNASNWQVGVIQAQPNGGGRAYFPSISCLPKINS